MSSLILIIACLLVIAQTGLCYNTGITSATVQGCSIASDVELGLIDSFKATTFQLNVTKKNEILRLKLYFRGLSPTIIIQYGQEQGLTFGNVNNMTTFGIYEKYSDFTAVKQNPKITKLNAKAFSEAYYTEMDMILTTGKVLKISYGDDCNAFISDGRFTVIVHGSLTDTFDLSFKKSAACTNINLLTVKFAATNGKNEKTRFLVDCPWKEAYLWTILPRV